MLKAHARAKTMWIKQGLLKKIYMRDMVFFKMIFKKS